MKKMLLTLALALSLHLKAENSEITQSPETTAPQMRVCDYQSQAPILARYFIDSCATGLGRGFAYNLFSSAFEVNDHLDTVGYSLALGNDLWNNLDAEQETEKCSEIAINFNRQFVHPLVWAFGNKEDKFQPEQFKVHNKAYTVAATLLGFASGAYVGSKLGNAAHAGCALLWNYYFPSAKLPHGHLA